MMKRKVTNKGFTMVYVNNSTFCIILVRLLYQQINKVDNVALLHELIVCTKTLIDQIGLLCAIVRIF